MKKLDIYTASVAFLVVGVYLHSPVVCLGGIVLWGFSIAEAVLSQKNKDSEIIALLQRMDKIEKDNKSLSMEVVNVAERAKTILGEVY